MACCLPQIVLATTALQFVQRLLCNSYRDRNRTMLMTSKTRNRFLRVEPLENRLMLDGRVSAEIMAGDAIITGDDLANEIVVEAGSQPGEIVVTGIGTQVNGKRAETLRGFTRDMKITMHNGDNIVTIHGGADGLAPETASLVPRKLVVETGGGNDEVRVENLVVAKSARFFTGAGDDKLTIGPGGCDGCRVGRDVADFSDSPIQGIRARNLKASTGGGDDVVNISNSIVEAILNVQTGNGDDLVNVNNTQAGKVLVVRTAAGNDVVNLAPHGFCCCILARANPLESILPDNDSMGVVADRAIVDTGPGNDKLGVARSEFHDRLDVYMRSGDNTALFYDTLLSNGAETQLNLMTGGGDDLIVIGGLDQGVTTGCMTIKTSGGADRVIVNHSFVEKDATVLLNTGDDTLETADFTVNRRALLNGGQGTDRINRERDVFFAQLAMRRFELFDVPV